MQVERSAAQIPGLGKSAPIKPGDVWRSVPAANPCRCSTIPIFDGCGIICFGMNSDLSQFIGDIWRYKPIIVILLVAGLIIFALSVIDTHRHRKKNHKKRHRTKHH
jgi:hypothetical protein